MSGVAAFFDIDNTIMRGASIYHLARGLFSRKILSATDLTNYAIAQGKFLMSGSENMNDLARITENALSFAQGRTVQEMNELCNEIYDEIMVDKVWPGTVQLAHTHIAAGHEVWLVSAGPIELAHIIAQRLGLTGALATVSEVIHGEYTGKLKSAPMHGEQKSIAIRELAEQRGIDLAHSFAYSDSKNDVPLLSAVGNPIAINPDSELREIAIRSGWPVHDFRREHLKKRYVMPAGAVSLALIGAATGLVISALSKNKTKN